jgi:hypothetical protein
MWMRLRGIEFMGGFLTMWWYKFLASAKRARVSLSVILIILACAAGASIYRHLDERRCNERAIYFVSWSESDPNSGVYPFHVSIDRRSDSEGANRNARDKTGTQRCIPTKYLFGDGKLYVGFSYVCGNNHLTENLQSYGRSIYPAERTVPAQNCEGKEKDADQDSSDH